jgi:hypothetical protein
MTKEEQIKIINDAIIQTKYNLKPLGFNLLFWGILIISMSLFHYFFPKLIQFSYYSAAVYWISIPVIGMIYTTYYNIKTGTKLGYETQLGRVIKIIWGVFGLFWLSIFAITIIQGANSPALDILFILAMVLVMTGLIIKFKNITIGGLLLLVFVVYNHASPGLNFLLMNVYGIAFGMLIPGVSLYRFRETK